MNYYGRTQQLVPVEVPEYDPVDLAQQFAIREYSGDLPSSGETITFRAWTIDFQQHPQSRARYRKLEKMLGEVNAQGYVPVKLQDVPGVRYSSMSERTDLLGEFCTIWITAVDSGSAKRGAVLACLNGAIVHLIATSLYEAQGDERAQYLVEALAQRIAAREPEMLMANEVSPEELISRLPSLEDVSEILDNAEIISTIN